MEQSTDTMHYQCNRCTSSASNSARTTAAMAGGPLAVRDILLGCSKDGPCYAGDDRARAPGGQVKMRSQGLPRSPRADQVQPGQQRALFAAREGVQGGPKDLFQIAPGR